MNKTSANIIAAFITACAALTSLNGIAAQKFGFGTVTKPSSDSCSLWGSLYPISVQQPEDEPVKYYVNFIWVEANSYKGIDEYADFYITPYSQNAWPSSINILTDGGQAFCMGDGECTSATVSEVNKGISAYENLKAEFPDKKVSVVKAQPDGTGILKWFYLPLRKVDLLRIEVFTPLGSLTADNEYVEPVFFEYRATGKGSELKLHEWGSTSDDKTYISLPETFNPVLTSDIQVWFTRTNQAGPAWGITPKAHIDFVTTAQSDRVPSSCK
ncbi:hypothetical protein [Enterobacter sp. GD03975]|uniref:hypothetical protein n=1 Tax=Enterobacter sp. GD03975 TaxID=2975412 RepID=UPI0024473DA7|nr:hypothetical protein [Enterobacter sp. GD03975]MDH1126968.1 hypothetical protein [Enterobacter sp. GD03975]